MENNSVHACRPSETMTKTRQRRHHGDLVLHDPPGHEERIEELARQAEEELRRLGLWRDK